MSRTKLKKRAPERITDYPKVYRDALAYWEGFRRFGFSADEIFFGFGTVDGEPDMVHLQLQTQGKTFTVVVGELHVPRKRAFKTWQSLARLMNGMPSVSEEWNVHVWKQGPISNLTNFALFATGIQEKGIIIPELAPLMAQGQA